MLLSLLLSFCSPRVMGGRVLSSSGFRAASSSRGVRRLGVVFALLVAGLTAPRDGAQVIDTATSWLASGPDSWTSPFGEPAFGAWGQTFVTPAGFSRLVSFSVWLQPLNDPQAGVDAVDFAGKLYEWDPVGLVPVGEALYTSGQKHIAFQDPPPAFQEVEFDVGGLLLDPAKTYLFFLDANPYFDGTPGALNVGGGFNYDAYPGGNNYISEAGEADLFVRPWEEFGGDADMAFVARFSNRDPGLTPVPEPGTYGLGAAVLLVGLILVRRRGRVAEKE